MTIVSRMLERSPLPKGQRSLVSSPAKLPIDRPSLLTHVATLVDAALTAIAPWGYEDETGFHYGTPTSRSGPA